MADCFEPVVEKGGPVAFLSIRRWRRALVEMRFGANRMRYRWDDFSLDRDGALLTRQGQQVDVSRKVLDCISHLVEQRERVVSYDELIRKIWGHDNVTNHQLTQIVVAARRAIGDDGQAQRIIRTLSGLGYRWVGPVTQLAKTEPLPQTSSAEDVPSMSLSAVAASTSEAPQPEPCIEPVAATSEGRISARPRTGRRLVASVSMLSLVAVAAVYWFLTDSGPTPPAQAVAAPPSAPLAVAERRDPIASLRTALWKGQFETVSKGLATMSPQLAESPDAKLLEINLDIERGQFTRAAARLALQHKRAADAGDPVWRAKALTVQAYLNGASGKVGAEVLAPGASAVELLESLGRDAPQRALGEALGARGYGFMKLQRFESASRDLSLSRDILLKAGDERGASTVADTMARVDMRMGRFEGALVLMNEIAAFSRLSEGPVTEIYARNAATKIQVELLRWDDALKSSDRSIDLLRTVPDSERRTRVLQLRALALTGKGRLREASGLIEEIDALQDERYSTIVAAAHYIATGRHQKALAAASEAYGFEAYAANDTLNLESKEGALLLWLIAAQEIAKERGTMPALSPAQIETLSDAESDIGRIARGRWRLSQGRSAEAEAEFRRAFAEARAMGHLSRMLAAAEPLVESLLLRGDAESAQLAVAELWGYAPERLAQDFRANLLALSVARAVGDAAAEAEAYRNAMATAGEREIPESRSAP